VKALDDCPDVIAESYDVAERLGCAVGRAGVAPGRQRRRVKGLWHTVHSRHYEDADRHLGQS
jgi:hypothetical protein